MARKALVTGAAGFIGSNLADRLIEQGYSVIGIDNLRTGTMSNLEQATRHPNFEFIRADICDTDLLGFASDNIDVVFHLAAISSVAQSVEDPLSVNETNVNGTVNVLRHAVDHGVRRFVFISSAAVYGQPSSLPVTEDAPIRAMSPYGASKIAGEQYVRAFKTTYGMETVILRYFNVYGPRQALSEYSGVVSIFINRALHDEPLTIYGDGLQTRTLIFVDDVTEYTMRAAEVSEADGAVLNICGPDALRVIDIAETILRLIPESRSEIRYAPARPGDIRESVGSLDLACKVLGYSPVTAFEDGISRTIQWYRELHRR